MTFTPSPHQLAIFDFIETGTGSLIVIACAGSGKSTTIELAARRIPTSKSILELVFNKSIAEAAQARMPQNVQVKTFHSHCNGVLQRSKKRKVDSNKCKWILKDMVTEKEFFTYSAFVLRLVSYMKAAGTGVLPDAPTADEIIAHHNLFLDNDRGDEARAVALAQTTLDASNKDLRIDFDDMLYLPLLEGSVFDKFNFIFVDEAQDTNAVQRALLRKMMGPHTRIIAVGDPNQAIYGFRGADATALDAIAEDFDAVRLPLSVSYRCARAIVREAQKHV